MDLDQRLSALNSLPPLRDVISEHELSAQKSLGQNFLLDQNVTDKITRSAGDLSGATVFEIGPGPGGLTRSLLKSAASKVIAIEFDSRAVEALQSLKACAPDDVEIIHGDALKAVLSDIAPTPRAIVANLPYNIAAPLLINWLKEIRVDYDAYRSMTLMFQKEVGDRLAARPGEKAYGRLSVIAQWLCNVRSVYELPPSAFTPPPKVKSSVVHFVPKVLDAGAPSFQSVGQVTAAAFGQRRKMIRSSLKAYLPRIEELGIDPTLRAENLSVEDFLNIAR